MAPYMQQGLTIGSWTTRAGCWRATSSTIRRTGPPSRCRAAAVTPIGRVTAGFPLDARTSELLTEQAGDQDVTVGFSVDDQIVRPDGGQQGGVPATPGRGAVDANIVGTDYRFASLDLPDASPPAELLALYPSAKIDEANDDLRCGSRSWCSSRWRSSSSCPRSSCAPSPASSASTQRAGQGGRRGQVRRLGAGARQRRVRRIRAWPSTRCRRSSSGVSTSSRTSASGCGGGRPLRPGAGGDARRRRRCSRSSSSRRWRPSRARGGRAADRRRADRASSWSRCASAPRATAQECAAAAAHRLRRGRRGPRAADAAARAAARARADGLRAAAVRRAPMIGLITLVDPELGQFRRRGRRDAAGARGAGRDRHRQRAHAPAHHEAGVDRRAHGPREPPRVPGPARAARSSARSASACRSR